MIKIISIKKEPIEVFPFWCLPAEAETDQQGRRVAREVNLEIYQAMAKGLPPEMDALVVTSDLQGVVMEKEQAFLLGEKLAEFLSLFIALEFPAFHCQRIGVLLCGDLYANLHDRGVGGDVKEVWRKFNKEFKWVIGVAGDHDDFGSEEDFEAFKKEEGIYFIGQQMLTVDKMAFAGISGIIGRPDKPQRVAEKDYLAKLAQLLRKQPSAVLLHQSPDDPARGLTGSEKIRAVLEKNPPALIFCGHSHWEIPLVELENKSQVLNVDNRVVILVNHLKYE